MKNLKELIQINSYSNKDNIIKYLTSRFKPYAKEMLILQNKENSNKSLIVGLNTNLKNISPIVLSGHIDTVAPDLDKYNTNPLELTLLNGKAYGLGSIDMKSFVAVILDHIESLTQLDYPLVLSFTTDEETELFCINNIIKKFKELNILPVFSIIGEPTNSQINNQSNGCFEFDLEVVGKSCHSSLPTNGINAINIASQIITFIESAQTSFEDLTSNVGTILGGDIVNRVPDYCKIKFDIRSVKSKHVDNFLSRIKLKIQELESKYFGSKITLTKMLEIPPLEIKEQNFIKNIATKFNLKINKFSGGCEAGYYQQLSGNAIIFGVGDINLAHKPNEFVVVDEYKKYSNNLIKMLQYVAQQIK